MSLHWKDAGTTLLTAGVITLSLAAAYEWWSFITVRKAIAGMLLLGVGACALGAYNTNNVPAFYSIAMGALVIAAGVTILLGLIFGNKAYAVVLAVLIGLLWLASTIRHAII